jgi:signal transduction histidine kinase
VSKPIKAVQIDLREEIHNALVILGLNAKTTGVQLINEVSDGVKLYVIKPYFISVITNLITNAIKYSDPLKKSYLKITSRPISKEGLLEIVFEDNGIGIDLIKNRDKLFTLYGTFISNKESRGVGLYLASNQIELMNGSIDVESEIGVGSSFIIKLPIDC